MIHHEQVRRSLEIDDIAVERSSQGRILTARALTYNTPYDVSDDGGRSWYQEVWRAGVFTKSLTQRAGKIPMLITHDRRAMPIGATIGAVDDPGAFIFRAKVSNTQAGDEALELINDGALTGISVGAVSLKDREVKRGVVERIEAKLAEISLTPFAQMADGQVLAVRADINNNDDDDGEIIEQSQGTPALDEARRVVESLERP